jgi:hypothetical protein|tara:strand:+ start:466 stop:759 length:294 start_codon:yes stop_codon:yes gene_type:complete
MASCRSSGVLTASAVVSAERCKLVSIHAQLTGTNPTLVRVFDNSSAASGKELARINLVTSKTDTIEFDMHGVIASNGLYLDIATGTGVGAAVSVEFA